MIELLSGGVASNLLLIGVFLGMRHALEADHVAAITSITSNKQSISYTLKQGVAWGLGHTITLLLFGSIVIFMDTVMPEYLAVRLEIAVGIMLIILGIGVLRRLIKSKAHFHGHEHENGNFHFHAHSHAGEVMSKHQQSPHEHQHREVFPVRAMLIGLMHGMAGSAAVILLTVDMGTTPLQGILYILLFGMGSIIGMAILTVIISFAMTVPKRLFSSRITWTYNFFQLMVGTITVGLGMLVVYQNSLILV